MKKGKIINFEGMDYSFKETNSKKLCDYLISLGYKTKLYSFPDYSLASSYYIKKYLAGEYGDATKLNGEISALFYATNIADALFIQNNIYNDLKEYDYIIMDRYVLSNIAFQCTKKDVNYYFIKALEYEAFNFPKEDIVIYMDMPVRYSHELIKQRDLKNGKDIDQHESNYLYKLKVEKLYKKYLDRHKHCIIHCLDSNHNIKSEENIFDMIIYELSRNHII